MFTGIIEESGTVVSLKKNKSNLDISVQASFMKEIKVDQSIAHNGVCLTVAGKTQGRYTVTAIHETLSKTTLKFLKIGEKINLERCMKADGRFDGHIVQGHVDCIAEVDSIKEQDGSWLFKFKVQSSKHKAQKLLVEKGSVCINGVSLTIVDCSTLKGIKRVFFSVAIIPYTYHHTNFKYLKPGDFVNVEFDIIGKYVNKMLEAREKS